MPRNSPVSGVSGAVRIHRLSGVSLAAAEAHGKRLDKAGPARRVRDAEALTNTGLDLRDLHKQHISDAHMRKGPTVALHMVLQFPTDLVDGEDEEKQKDMLKHARSFAEGIFGDAAIFGDRVDQDETSRHVVDLFLAPKYTKTTKRGSKLAVSTSIHLKKLAEERGKPPTLKGQGQALQDAWFEYLRDEMNLDVKRGAEKVQPGGDWQTPEALELERQREELETKKAEVEEASKLANVVAQHATRSMTALAYEAKLNKSRDPKLGGATRVNKIQPLTFIQEFLELDDETISAFKKWSRDGALKGRGNPLKDGHTTFQSIFSFLKKADESGSDYDINPDLWKLDPRLQAIDDAHTTASSKLYEMFLGTKVREERAQRIQEREQAVLEAEEKLEPLRASVKALEDRRATLEAEIAAKENYLADVEVNVEAVTDNLERLSELGTNERIEQLEANFRGLHWAVETILKKAGLDENRPWVGYKDPNGNPPPLLQLVFDVGKRKAREMIQALARARSGPDGPGSS